MRGCGKKEKKGEAAARVIERMKEREHEQIHDKDYHTFHLICGPQGQVVCVCVCARPGVCVCVCTPWCVCAHGEDLGRRK